MEKLLIYLKDNMDILIWGTKTLAKSLCAKLGADIRIVGFIDNDKSKHGKTFAQQLIYPPEKIREIPHDCILIASGIHSKEIYSQLVNELEYNPANIIAFGYYFNTEDILKPISQNTQRISELIDISDLKGTSSFPTDLVLTEKTYYQSAYESVLDGEDNNIYQIDYKRYKTFELCAEEILSRNLTGAVAEFGVFSGVFAKIINKKFKDKKLYLFDTFEGFPEADMAAEEIDEQTMNFHNEAFKDITVESVLRLMPNRKNCLVKKGYFPDTTHDCLDENFCFVSLDVDLYTPIYNGLEYFYPRLVAGGYIFVHEYNSNLFPNCKKAVHDFEAKYGIVAKVPISDFLGTLVITK